MKKVLTLAVAAALAGGAAMSHAYEPGDWILVVTRSAEPQVRRRDGKAAGGVGVTRR